MNKKRIIESWGMVEILNRVNTESGSSTNRIRFSRQDWDAMTREQREQARIGETSRLIEKML